MKYLKIISLSLSLVILSALVFVGVASAQSFKVGNEITVATSKTIDSMLFAAGNNIDIAGIVNGDVYCAGQNITISGVVKGDVFCAGQAIIISGSVEGSVRLAGQSVTLSGIIGNSATIATQNLTIEKTGMISRDLFGASQNVMLNGQIGRDIVAGSQNLTINGEVGRDINGGVNMLTIGSTGQISGNVSFVGSNDPVVVNGGKIVGTVTRTLPKKNLNKNLASPMTFIIGGFVYIFIAMIVTALAIAQLFRRTLEVAALKTFKSPGRTILTGILAMIIAPIAIVILLMTVIGIPLAILTMLAWLIIMIISTPFAGYLLGRGILRTDKYPCTAMFLGTSVLIVTYFIPIVGFITMLVACIFGVGMILIQTKKLFAR